MLNGGRVCSVAPLSTPAPMVTALSSTALHVAWEAPSRHELRGRVVSYTLLLIQDSDLQENPFDPPTYAEVRDSRLYCITLRRVYCAKLLWICLPNFGVFFKFSSLLLSGRQF